MYKKEEKLSLLTQMIEFAKADHKIKDEEYNFILTVASQLGIDEEAVGFLVRNKAKNVNLQPESQRILQFHRLILLMNIDQENSLEEIHKIKNFGLQMGLRPEAIETVLEEMNDYENKIIPPIELLKIFAKYYN